MNLEKLEIISGLMLLFHILSFVVCYFIVMSSIGGDSVEKQAWKGINPSDSNKSSKVIAYVMGVYIGATDSGIEPISDAAFFAAKIVFFFRLLFVLNVIKTVFILALRAARTSQEPNIDQLVKNSIVRVVNDVTNQSMTPQWKGLDEVRINIGSDG